MVLCAMSEKVYLIGVPIDNIVGRKLPILKEVVALFFYHHKILISTVSHSALAPVKNVQERWTKAGVPICGTQNAIRKLQAVFKKWKDLQRNAKRKQSLAQSQKEAIF